MKSVHQCWLQREDWSLECRYYYCVACTWRTHLPNLSRMHSIKSIGSFIPHLEAGPKSMKTYKKKKETVTRRSLSNPPGTVYQCAAQRNKRRSFIQHWFTVVVIDTSGSLKPLWQYNPLPLAHLEVWYVAGTQLAEYTNSVCYEHNRLLAETLNASLKCLLVQVHMEYTIFYMCVVLYKHLCISSLQVHHVHPPLDMIQQVSPDNTASFIHLCVYDHFCFNDRWSSMKARFVVNLLKILISSNK